MILCRWCKGKLKIKYVFDDGYQIVTCRCTGAQVLIEKVEHPNYRDFDEPETHGSDFEAFYV